MPAAADDPLRIVLDRVAEPTPAPGGGSSSAWALALGAGLVEMAAAISGDGGAGERPAQLRAEALELAERELGSYEPVLEALRLPRSDPSREARVAEELERASEAPLAIAEGAAEAAELGARVAEGAGPAVRGDALTGVLLAEAAAAAAAALVAINLSARPESEPARRAGEAAARAAAARERACAGSRSGQRA